MHDYTARIIHEDRTAQFRRDADASRLAAEARQGRPSNRLTAGILGFAGLALARWTERRADRARAHGAPALNGREAATITPAAE